MRVGFTGTQVGMSPFQRAALWKVLRETAVEEFHHGLCLGADEEAHEIAVELGLRIIGHPPIKTGKKMRTKPKEFVCICRPREYLARNHDIVDETDMLIAAPKFLHEELRSGTWATVRYAQKHGKPVTILRRR